MSNRVEYFALGSEYKLELAVLSKLRAGRGATLELPVFSDV